MTLTSAAASGDRLTALKELRDSLAKDLEQCQSLRDKAALAKRFMDVLDQIEGLSRQPARGRKTGLSEFERRLREREAETTPKTKTGRNR